MDLPESVNNERLPRQKFMEQGGSLQGAWIPIKRPVHSPIKKTKRVEERYLYSLARKSVWRWSQSE